MLPSTARGMFEVVNTTVPGEPPNVYRQASLEVIFGQVWTRTGLTVRERRWLSLTAAGTSGSPIAIGAQVYGALNSGDISAEEMGEFLLHFACYSGFPAAAQLDRVVADALDRIASEPDGPSPARGFAGLQAEPLVDLVDTGRAIRAEVLGADAARLCASTPASDLLTIALEYGHVWSRPQLARSDRRLITLTCLAVQREHELLRAHLSAALEAGEFDVSSLSEVALHVGLYAGVPAGTALDRALSDAVETLEAAP